MPTFAEKAAEAAPLSPRAKRIGWAAAALIRLFALTYRWRIDDPHGFLRQPQDESVIWLIWHNRIFPIPAFYTRFINRFGAILSSPSSDGAIISAIMQNFGFGSIRGSSSRRGAAALLAMKEWLTDGYDVVIIPDGPRGPVYRLGPGAIKLSSITGSRILPLQVEFGSAWKFKSWDRFRLPKPFTKVTLRFPPLVTIGDISTPEKFETERLRIETLLNPNHETD